MSVGQYCNREVIVAPQDMSIKEAARLMRERHVGDLVVVEEETPAAFPVGLVTDRDLVIEVLAQDVDPEAVALKDIMSHNPVTATDDEPLLDALERMRRRGVRRLPVVDHTGVLQGILTADDALELICEQLGDLVHLVNHEISLEARHRP